MGPAEARSMWAEVVIGNGRWFTLCATVLCAAPAPAGPELADISCDPHRHWQVTVSAPSADRELTGRLVAVALRASGESSVTIADEHATGRTAETDRCMGLARVQVTRDASNVTVELGLKAVDSAEEVRGAGSAASLLHALEDALAAAKVATRGTPLVALLPPPPCELARSPAVRALLVGINDYAEESIPGWGHISDLAGCVRDVSLVEGALKSRYPAASITTLLDRAATGAGLHRALTALVEESQCGDVVFIHYSGHAQLAAKAGPDVDPRDVARMALILSDGKRMGESRLRGFVTALRNRRAFVIVLLDTHAAGVSLATVWRRWHETEAELLRGAGECAVMTAGASALEYRFPEGPAGYFSLAAALALRREGGLTVRSLASAITENLQQLGMPPIIEHTPFFEATSPDARLLSGVSDSEATLLTVQLDGEQLGRGVKVLEPDPASNGGRTVVVAGIVAEAERLSALLVNGAPAALEPGGRFRVELELKPGLQKVHFVGVRTDLSLATGEREVQVGAEGQVPLGRSYALLIGIQQYDKWTPLETPVADVRAVGRILRDRYGFVTTLATFGELVLENPDKITIGSAFLALRRTLGPDDNLLIYYAGHGKAEGTTERRRGFWIPRDADAENRATWYSGQDLLNEIEDMRARHVLVVSDSCFSGDLTRDKPNPPAEMDDAERRRLLVERGARKSRILITSGYDEPVLDLGGGGHSVFARALIDGLERIPDERFLSFDLFSRFIYQQVGGKSPQQPHHLFLVDSGHDGGDMLFVRGPAAK